MALCAREGASVALRRAAAPRPSIRAKVCTPLRTRAGSCSASTSSLAASRMRGSLPPSPPGRDCRRRPRPAGTASASECRKFCSCMRKLRSQGRCVPLSPQAAIRPRGRTPSPRARGHSPRIRRSTGCGRRNSRSRARLARRHPLRRTRHETPRSRSSASLVPRARRSWPH